MASTPFLLSKPQTHFCPHSESGIQDFPPDEYALWQEMS